MKNPETVAAAGVDRNTSGRSNLRQPRHIVKKDAEILQFLKSECERTGAGNTTLEEVFRGLLSVHNRHLSSFADAIREAANGE